MVRLDAAQLSALAGGLHGDPFSLLGPHPGTDGWTVRCLLPGAERVEIVDRDGNALAVARPLTPADIFEAELAADPGPYRLRIGYPHGVTREVEDPYRFASPLGELDLHLMGEGTHLRLYECLGARCTTVEGVDGVYFGVWAPNASRVSVVGNFNHWDGRVHPMRRHPVSGAWDLFVPGLEDGCLYKFELLSGDGERLPLKADPFARRMEAPPGNACIVHRSRHLWRDDTWMQRRHEVCATDAPMAIYEVHLGSWRRSSGNESDRLSYQELARELVDYVRDMGFTHVEFLPITEHPFEGSWGYQPIGLFAPTWRHGDPDACKVLIEACHLAGIGVIMDWVPAHFPRDAYGLSRFDGTCLYEHADPRRGVHLDWGTLIYNYGRTEVVNYLIASALWWIEHYHVDALRVDAVASMLYLDYSREDGQWLANEHGGNENLEAIDFLRRLNEAVHAAGGVTMAEESTAWPGVSSPVSEGGLGFSYKWNMGWMHDTLDYMALDPVHRKHHHGRMSFGLLYAFSESFILPLSHDEVVHGKGSLITRMPGDTWQKFANLRLYFCFMYASPGKKLLFMGGEFAQIREWSVDRSLDWALLEDPFHRGVQSLLRDLNRVHAALPALHRFDTQSRGFAWIDCHDRDHGVFTLQRRGLDGECIVAVFNFTPVVREGYHVGVPQAGVYREILNSDAPDYGGSGVANPDHIHSTPTPANGFPDSLALRLPPLAALLLRIDVEKMDFPQ